jgi:hypothetical protein
MKQALRMLAATAAALLCIACGNGSEITNGFHVVNVVVCGGRPADSAMVIAFPRGYDPVPGGDNSILPETTVTDAGGRFVLMPADSARNLLVYDRTRTCGAFVPISRNSSPGTIVLDSLGYLRGMNNDTAFRRFNYISISGSPFFAQLEPLDSFMITKLPPYTYSICVRRSLPCRVFPDGTVHCPATGGSGTGLAVTADTLTVTVTSGTGLDITIGP